MTRRIRIAIFLGVALLSCPLSWAATLNGRLTTSLYTWERQEADTSSSSHLRAYQSVTLDAGELGDRRLSFHTYALVTGDVSGPGNRGQRFRLYNAYFRWKEGGRTPTEVSAGRQRVYEGVGYGTMDGLRASVTPGGAFTLTGYVGTLAPLVTRARIEDWSDGHMWGGRLTTDRIGNTSVGLSYAHRNRRPLPYLAPGRYSGLVFDITSEQQELAGLDVHRAFQGGVDLYVRLDYDLLGGRVRQAEGIARVAASEHLTVAFEGFHRAPVVNANSIFSVFDIEDSQEYAVRGNYTVNRLVSVYGNFAEVVYEGARAQRVGFGFGVGQHSVSYTRRIGEGGENDALSVSLAQAVSRFVTLRADGGVASYRLTDGVGKKLMAMSGALGITCRPGRRVTLDAEAQALRDRIYANDFRFFLRGTVWFFKGKRR
jgi:hypothetical protein